MSTKPENRILQRRVIGDYDPVQTLDDEVERFRKTNLFTPIEVTHFYIQARVVLNYLNDLENEVRRLHPLEAKVRGSVLIDHEDWEKIWFLARHRSNEEVEKHLDAINAKLEGDQ